jgi:hypothetical protein
MKEAFSVEYSVLHKLFSPPYIWLIVGLFFISMGGTYTSMGRAWVRFSGWIYRTDEPRIFWGEVAMHYLIGACFIGYFMYLGTTVGYPPLR